MIESFPELKFIGSGDAFNIERGNTSAYFIFKKTLVLIDCGETVFSRIIKLKLLKDIDRVIILITHLHSDHVGSLGTFVAYLKFIAVIKPEIYIPNDDFMNYINNIGIESTWYQGYIVGVNKDFPIIHDNNNWIYSKYIYTNHKPEMNCYGLILGSFVYKLEGEILHRISAIYYSGDSYIIPNEILILLINNELDRLYQDTCSYKCDNNPHMNIEKLIQSIPDNYKKYIYCMHIDQSFDIDKAKSYGFNVVRNEQYQEKRYSIDEIKAYLLYCTKPSSIVPSLGLFNDIEKYRLILARQYIDYPSIEYFLNNSNWKELAEIAKNI